MEDDVKGGTGAGGAGGAGMRTGRGGAGTGAGAGPGDEEKGIISSVVGYARELESIV